jgi:hypothetical protein
MSVSFEERRLSLVRETQELWRDSQERLHELGVPMLDDKPKKHENTFIVRISAKEAVRDYEEMKVELKEVGSAKWDSDKNNMIGKCDWLGFIVGDDWQTAEVELYKVEEILSPSNRKKTWANKSHTGQNTAHVKDRNVLILSQLKRTDSWSWWKSVTGYKESYVPRGTTKAKTPFHN